jgi:hypothetical protein
MKNIYLRIVLSGMFFVRLAAQTPVDIADNTIKVSGLGEEVFYYGFAGGDQLIFNFKEIDGKDLKEIEITEFPSSSKFTEYKTNKVENMTLKIERTAVYKFRFTNGTLFGRICKINIRRIPADSTKKFNPVVYWKTVQDTSYTTEPEEYIVRTDTVFSNLTDMYIKVHSRWNVNNNRKNYFYFTLPNNTLAWSYYIGVNRKGQEAYEMAAQRLSTETGYSPLAALIYGRESYLPHFFSGEDIDYSISDGNFASTFLAVPACYVNKRKVITDFSKMTHPVRGKFRFGLHNNNLIIPVNVVVKIATLNLHHEWATRPVQRMHIAKKQEAYLRN